MELENGREYGISYSRFFLEADNYASKLNNNAI